MEILNIGPLELLLILVLMIVVLGPKEMVILARKAGVLIRKVIQSPYWKTMMDATRQVKELPAQMMKEAGIENEIGQLKEIARVPGQMLDDAKRELKTTTNLPAKVINEIKQDMQLTVEPIEIPKYLDQPSVTSPPQGDSNKSPGHPDDA